MRCARGAPCCWRRSAETSSQRASRQTTRRGTFLARKDATTRQTLIFDDNHLAAALYGEGDRTLVFVPPWEIHLEENLDPDGIAEFLLARNTMEGIVVNVPDPRT